MLEALKWPLLNGLELTNGEKWLVQTEGNQSNDNISVNLNAQTLDFWSNASNNVSSTLGFRLIDNWETNLRIRFAAASQLAKKIDFANATFEFSGHGLSINSPTTSQNRSENLLELSGVHGYDYSGGSRKTIYKPTTILFQGTDKKNEILYLKSNSKDTGIYIYRNAALKLEDLSELAIIDTEVAMAITGKLSNVAQSQDQQYAAQFLSRNLNSIWIGNSNEGSMRRGIFSYGDTNVDLQAKDNITISISNGWQGPGYCKSGKCYASGAVMGNGFVKLKSNAITLNGQHTRLTDEKKSIQF